MGRSIFNRFSSAFGIIIAAAIIYFAAHDPWAFAQNNASFGGGVAVPGSSGQIVYNGSGAFAADQYLTYNHNFSDSELELTDPSNGNRDIDLSLALGLADFKEVNICTSSGGTQCVVRLDNSGAIQIAGGTPTGSGSCAIKSQTGGNTAGTFTSNGGCSSSTVILSFGFTANNGWTCDTHDLTTPTDAMNETATGTGSVTFTGTMAANDVVAFKCVAF